MRSCLPILLAGLWLLVSCSSDNSDGPPKDELPDPGVATNYNVFIEENGSYSFQDFAADALDIEPVGSVGVNSSANPLFSDIEQSVFGLLLPRVDCGVDILRITPESTSQKSILEKLEACSIEVLGFAQSTQASFIVYSDTDPVSSEITYSVRSMSADGMSIIDAQLPGRAVDLDFASGKLFVLAYLSEAESNSAILEYNQDLSGDPVAHPVSTGGKLLTSLGSDRILLGFDDAHQVYQASSMTLADNILYQPGTEPGFTHESPASDPQGSLLYYLFDDPQTPVKERIAAIYESDRRTLVLYLVENFLSPDQREFQFDVGTVSAVGYDWANDLLIIGYQRASTPSMGGLLRLGLQPEFKFLDQTDLPGVPLIIYTSD